MREELLRQIEEKKKREEESKKKRLEDELKEENRIKQELEQLHQEEGFDPNSTKGRKSIQMVKQNSHAPSNDGFLPELTNRTSEPLKHVVEVDNDLQLKQQSHSAQPNFETTAAFANYDPKNKTGMEEENIANLGGGGSFGNANNDQSKIKEMINQ